MNKLFSRWVSLGLWQPAAALMRNLHFPAKMGIIALASLVPVGWLLGAFIQSELVSTSFVTNERSGVRVAQAVYPLLQASAEWRYQARNVAFGVAGASPTEARAAFDARFAALQAVQADTQAGLSTGPAWQQLQQAVQSAKTADQGQAEAVYTQMTALSRAITQYLSAVTDQSGLALDPELATYYLMSATVIRMPQVIEGIAELRGLVGGALQTGEVSPDRLMRIAQRVAIVAHEADLADGELAKVRAADGKTTQALRGEGVVAARELLKAVGQLLGNGTLAPGVDRATFVTQANQALARQHDQVAQDLVTLDSMLAQRQGQLGREMWLTVGITLAALLLTGYLVMGFYAALTSGFKLLRKELLALSMGDMRNDIALVGKDEVTGLLRELSYMQAGLRDTMRQVRHSSNEVVNASIEIAVGTQDLSERTEAAAAALEESSAALEQTTSTTAHTVDAVNKATALARDNASVASRGEEVVAEVVRTMEHIQASSGKISEIIGVIDGIAFQTNILALNAAVEAARAGESGRGFAVVASEVRNLAQRSAGAAKEIKTLINASVEQVTHGTEVVRGAGTAMHEIVETADKVRSLMDEVLTAAREQNLGIAQIGVAVQELDHNTQANASLVEEAAAAASAQRDAALRMAAMVDEFRLAPGKSAQVSKVDGIDIDAIIDGHRQWKVKLRDAIETQSTVDTATLSRDDCCPLGKWVYGTGGQHFGHQPSFTALVERHKTFHKVAGSVGELINRKQYLEAEQAVAPGTPFATATREVVQVLSAAKRIGF